MLERITAAEPNEAAKIIMEVTNFLFIYHKFDQKSLAEVLSQPNNCWKEKVKSQEEKNENIY